MAAEIERKFLVLDDSWRSADSGTKMAQGYLSLDPDRTVRVRVAGENAWLTIKGRTKGITRAEFEYPIPLEDAEAMLAICLPSVIDKTRHRVLHAGHLWEIDVFHGENAGLTVAEVELTTENEALELPHWAGEEVSGDARYFNSYLAAHPFQSWGTIL